MSIPHSFDSFNSSQPSFSPPILGSPSLTMLEPQLLTIQKPFALLLEFHQGKKPGAVWKCGTEEDFEDLLMYVISVSVFPDRSFDSLPVTFVSSYGKIWYVAVYFNVLDIHARGFIRSISLLIGFTSKITISSFFSQREKIINFVNRIAEKPKNRFPDDLKQYMADLDATFSATDNQNLLNKKQELESIVQEFHFSQDKTGQVQSEEYFLYFTPELKPLIDFCGCNDILDELEKVISSFTFLPFEIPFLRKEMVEIPQLFDGFPFKEIPSYIDFPSLHFFYRLNLLKHLIFPLISGGVLIIHSQAYEIGRNIADELSFFIPYFNQSLIGVEAHPMHQKNVIVITSSVDPIPGYFALNMDEFFILSFKNFSSTILNDIIPPFNSDYNSCDKLLIFLIRNRLNSLCNQIANNEFKMKKSRKKVYSPEDSQIFQYLSATNKLKKPSIKEQFQNKDPNILYEKISFHPPPATS